MASVGALRLRLRRRLTWALGITMNALPFAQREAANRLFRITLHIGRGTNTDMPEPMVGAFVPVFVAALDHESAAQNAVRNVTMRGFTFIDIADRQIHELDATKWDEFVRDAWPDFSSHFPSQAEVLSKLQSELLFTGPFSGYNQPSDAQPFAAANGFAAR